MVQRDTRRFITAIKKKISNYHSDLCDYDVRMVACVSSLKVVLLLVIGVAVMLTVMNFRSLPGRQPSEAIQCMDKKFTSFSQDRIMFHRYADETGPLRLPSAHYEWVKKNEKHILRFFDSVRCHAVGSSVIDVGMNDGTYSVLAAKRGCRVISFELQTQCISLACMLLQFNQVSLNVSIYQKPVSDTNGREYFLNVNGDCTHSSGTFGLHRSITGSSSVKSEKLLSTTLDYALSTENRIEFLKLDIEGLKPQALWGAQGLFKRNIIRKAVVECNRWPVKSFAETISNVSQLYDWGYNIECLDIPRMYETKRDWLELQGRTSCGCIDLGITLVVKTSASVPSALKLPTSVNGERAGSIRRLAFIIRTNKDTPFIRAQTAKIANELRACEGHNISIVYLFHADDQQSESVQRIREYVHSIAVDFVPFFWQNMTSVTGPRALAMTSARHFQFIFHEPSIVFWWKSAHIEYDFIWVQEDDAFFNGNLCRFVSHRKLQESLDLVSPSGCDTSRSARGPERYDYQMNFSTWKVPVKRFRNMNENIVGYSSRLLGVIMGFLKLDLLLYGEYFPCTICSSLPWCKAQSLGHLQLTSKNFHCCRHPLSGEEFLRITSSQDERWYHRIKWENIPRKGKPKLLVLQSDDRKIGDQFLMLNKETAAQNRFDYVKKDGRSLFPPHWQKVPPYWQKVFEVQRIMREKHVDYIFWLDSDALIMNTGSIFRLLQEGGNCSMWISPDPLISNSVFNSGAFIVMNDESGMNLIDAWASLYNSSKWAFSNNRWTTNGTWAGLDYDQGSFAKNLWQRHSVCKCPYYVFNEMSCDKLRYETISVHLAGHLKYTNSSESCIQLRSQLWA